jgi:RNA polymerase sigma-70 factor (ECF subfamily)
VEDKAALDDAELVARVCAGDTAAYGIVVRRYSGLAIRTAALLGAGADAEDVAQEAFVKAYRALGRFRPGSAFRPWLLAIVTNEARNRHRADRRRSDRELRPAIEPAPAGPDELAEAGERRDWVRRALAALPRAQREVLVCRYLLDLDERETAGVLGLAPGTVKSRASRGIRRMRAALGADLTALEVGGGH